jgi:hypothetical protein
VSLALHLLTDFGAWVRVGFTTKYLSTNIQRLLCCCRDLHDRRLVCAATKYQDQLVSILNHLLLTQLMRVGGCSFAENAESECERMVNEAMTIDQSNPEVYQVAASLRISQQRNGDALEVLQRGYALWKDLDPAEKPVYQSRTAAAKLFIELSQLPPAIQVRTSSTKSADTLCDALPTDCALSIIVMCHGSG